jgi:hypothetical protein
MNTNQEKEMKINIYYSFCISVVCINKYWWLCNCAQLLEKHFCRSMTIPD